jgi:hypothetical protein
MESHPTKLMGSKGYSNRYFDFKKLGEVSLLWPCWVGLLTAAVCLRFLFCYVSDMFACCRSLPWLHAT